MTLDSISGSMTIILTLASSSENHDIISSFIRETKDIIRATSSEPLHMLMGPISEYQNINSEIKHNTMVTPCNTVDIDMKAEELPRPRLVPFMNTMGKLWRRLKGMK